MNGRDMFVTASIGIAAYPPDGCDPDTLIKNADTAMYRAKQLGRNNAQFYTPAMNNRAMERLKLEMSLHRALERGEFLLHYQPKVSTRSGKLVGMEALLRWARPGHGLVSPAEFIPILEETGFIVQVGEWVLRAACAQLKASNSDGFRPVPIAVNLSARQLQSAGLLDMVRKIFNESGVDPALIELEITESSLMHNIDEAVVLLNALKKTGLRISIDDFGTGYSSIANDVVTCVNHSERRMNRNDRPAVLHPVDLVDGKAAPVPNRGIFLTPYNLPRMRLRRVLRCR